MSWNATMPRTQPKEDHVHFVLAIRLGSMRQELTGEMSLLKAKLLVKLASMKDADLQAYLKLED